MSQKIRTHRRPGGENILLIADSECDADLYYATRFLVGDPLIYLEVNGKKTLLVSDLEYGRACREAQVDEVVSITPYEEQLRARGAPVRLTSILDIHLREAGVRDLVVPSNFALGYAERLREAGYRITCREKPFFPERMVKSPAEVAAIRKSQEAAEECMAFLVETIRKSDIRDRTLYYDGRPLEADWLRTEAHKQLLDRGLHALHTIIAGGDQGCDPHLRGTGPLPAHETIILDVFPRSLETRYWGDITRTVVRGRASKKVRKLYDDVLAAQEKAFSMLREGIDGQEVHQAVSDLLQSRGNETAERDGKKTGFIHSTGHGIGLDIHEPPKIGRVKSKIKAGEVVTIEPGLYYPGVGAVRIEDIVVVRKDGCENLTSFPKKLELG